MAEASLRFTVASLSSGMPTWRTEYVCGHNTRSEMRSCRGHSSTISPTGVEYEYGPLRAHISNRALGYGFQLDLEERIYTGFRANEYGSPVWMKPRQRQPLKRSGRTVHIHTETIDTGERREFFGYLARHIITKTRQMRDAQLLNESETDGWYVDAPSAWLKLHPVKQRTFSCLVRAGEERDDYKFSETGNRETGFEMLATRTHRSPLLDETGTARIHESIRQEEITEFSETPLQPDLFVPPQDFRRVAQLPGEMRIPFPLQMSYRWEMLKDSFGLQNRVENFIHQKS